MKHLATLLASLCVALLLAGAPAQAACNFTDTSICGDGSIPAPSTPNATGPYSSAELPPDVEIGLKYEFLSIVDTLRQAYWQVPPDIMYDYSGQAAWYWTQWVPAPFLPASNFTYFSSSALSEAAQRTAFSLLFAKYVDYSQGYYDLEYSHTLYDSNQRVYFSYYRLLLNDGHSAMCWFAGPTQTRVTTFFCPLPS